MDEFLKSKGKKAINFKDGKKVPAKNGKFILALGEATGHHHELQVCEADTMTVFQELFGIEDLKVLDITKDAPLVHVGDDHNPIEVPAGKYVSYVQREYTPERVRRVID
jgi:hypothetical protein